MIAVAVILALLVIWVARTILADANRELDRRMAVLLRPDPTHDRRRTFEEGKQ